MGAEIVEADIAATLLDGGMQGHYGVTPPVLPSGQTYVSYYANESTAGHQNAKTLTPDAIQFCKELFIIRHIP